MSSQGNSLDDEGTWNDIAAPTGVPDVLARHIDAWVHGPPSALSEARAGRAALAEAVRLGTSRDGAWPLLAADALITSACARATGEQDPLGTLVAVFRDLAS